MKERVYLLVFFLLLAVLPMIYLENILVALSFYPLVILVVSIFLFIVSESTRTPAFVVFLVFLLFFFYIAPILQLAENPNFLVNTLPVTDNEIIFVNLLIFCASFVTCSIYILNYYFRKSKLNLKNLNNNLKFGHTFKDVPIILLLSSFLIGVVGYTETINGFADLINVVLEDKESSISNLIISKYLFCIPFVVFIAFKYENQIKNKFVYVILFFTILFTKNPILDHRNGLGPVYLILFFFSTLISIKNVKFSFFLVLILGIAFPLSSVFTHSVTIDDYNFDKLYYNLNFLSHFKDINYDAWSEIFAAIRYTEKYGFNYGYGILSSIFFFIPRSIWIGKSLASGFILGDFLSLDYSMWFTNLSCPVIGEGYLDFGIIGVLVYSVILSSFLVYVDKLNNDCEVMKRFLGLFLTFQILFIMRGSLMPALAYTIGFILAWLTIYKINIILRGKRNV